MKREAEERIHECIKEVMALYHVNTIQRCIPRMAYEDLIKELLIEICDNAIDYGISVREGPKRREQFKRYKFHLEHITFSYHDIFKIIGDVYMMMDKDEYFWKPKEGYD